MDIKKISPFQIGVFIACGIGILFGVLIFSNKIKIGKSKTPVEIGGTVTMWGTLPFDAMQSVTEGVTQVYKNVRVNYTQKDPKTFQSDLTNALASGKGPDIITLTPDGVIQNKDRILAIPFASLSETTFRTTFTDQGSLFLTNEGAIAFPFIVDPLVMYYNRDMLTSSFTVDAPKTWDDIIALNKKITQKDDTGKLITQTVALGTYTNITHAREMIQTFLFQAGNKIIVWNDTQKKYQSAFYESSNGESSAVNAFRSYTNFANSLDTDRYSWNSELPNDKNQFIAGKLAIYFGFASEMQSLRNKNPNLNFAVTMMPQRANIQRKATYGAITGIAVMKSSKNTSLAITVAQTMVGKDVLTNYIKEHPEVAPARRDMLGTQNDNALQTMIYNSAIISQSFLDPDASATSDFFKKFIGQINAGIVMPETVVTAGNSLMNSILEKIQK